MIIKLSKESIDVTHRFFEALDMLKQRKQIRGIKTFTDKYNLNYWNMQTLHAEQEKRYLKVEYLTYLVRDFGVSADWLLTGRGKCFADER